MHLSYSTPVFEQAYTYNGSDLGASWSPEGTFFRLWAPTAKAVSVLLYRSGDANRQDLIQSVSMIPDAKGTWIASVKGNLQNTYYTYLVNVNGENVEACDPYARAVGVNGKRAMVIDLQTTNPVGWEDDKNPNADMDITDCSIYELHIRDLSINYRSGIKNKGKYLGLCEAGTKTRLGDRTGLDHIKQLGISHIHLLPVYDFGSVDESAPDYPQYNWGYDPVNYNVPEGSYSTDPYHGGSRISEMKFMIKTLHDNGISVVMDVVYNHVYHTNAFCFNRIVPGYFSRQDENGYYSNGSGCGNDTASERSMVRKYIVDSVNYWADEYHIDGFRFDLVGLIDTDTINEIMTSVHLRHPSVIFYGEGWDMPTGITKQNLQMTTQKNAFAVPGFAFFNDTIRDSIRGSVFDYHAQGFVTGNRHLKSNIINCFMGKPGWCDNPKQIVNYVSCHDNHTLIDRISLALPGASRDSVLRRSNLSAAISILSQGIPFFQAGEEMLRTKPAKSGKLIGNSYRSPDSVNSIKWASLHDPDVGLSVRYYRGLLQIRKQFEVFRRKSREEIDRTIFLYHIDHDLAAAFLLYEKEYRILVAYNADEQILKLPLPAGIWSVLAYDLSVDLSGAKRVSDSIDIPDLSAAVLFQKKGL